MKWLAALLLAGVAAQAAGAEDAPRLFFSRSFPGSAPPYIQVTVDKSGAVEYREAVDDDLPLKFKLNPANTAELFGLAEKLDYFKNPLEAPVKVAFMGTKTFRYENGGEKTEVKFNYSQDVTAQALLDWFERLAETAQNRINLERAAKYDHLGVMKALLVLETALDRNRLAAPEQFLPLLDRIANNEMYMHTARARAAEIAETIRNPKK
ncbi:MAG TPA: hypothetical protein VLW65_13905 [Bryobacteraceae bacterium]|nr:hypothetical protein [Bryobacteraceae bacterium]